MSSKELELVKEEDPAGLQFFVKRSVRKIMKKKGWYPLYIIDLDSEEFPNRYRLCAEVTRHPNKNNELYQNGNFYKIIKTIYIPSDKNFKKVMKPFVKKIPETGRTKYNFTFDKKDLDEVTKILVDLGKSNE